MADSSILMVVARVDTENGETLLQSLADGEVPCEMRWSYGPDTTEVLDVVGEAYEVLITKLTQPVS